MHSGMRMSKIDSRSSEQATEEYCLFDILADRTSFRTLFSCSVKDTLYTCMKKYYQNPRRYHVSIFILQVHPQPSSVFVHWRHQVSISTLHAEDWTRTGSKHIAMSQITLSGPRLKIRLEKIKGFRQMNVESAF